MRFCSFFLNTVYCNKNFKLMQYTRREFEVAYERKSQGVFSDCYCYIISHVCTERCHQITILLIGRVELWCSRVPWLLLSLTGINVPISRNYFSSRMIFVASIPPNNWIVPDFRQNCQRKSRTPRRQQLHPQNISSSRDTNTPNVATMAWKTFQGTYPALLQTTLLSLVRLEIISPRGFHRDFRLFQIAGLSENLFCFTSKEEERYTIYIIVDRES